MSKSSCYLSNNRLISVALHLLAMVRIENAPQLQAENTFAFRFQPEQGNKIIKTPKESILAVY